MNQSLRSLVVTANTSIDEIRKTFMDSQTDLLLVDENSVVAEPHLDLLTIPIACALRINGVPEKEITDWRILYLASLISVLILLNKAFNDIVHVSRAFAGFSKLSDSKDSSALVSTGLYVAVFVTVGHLVAILGSHKFDTK